MAGDKPLLSTQLSILLAGCFIGAGLFFGLRASAPMSAPGPTSPVSAPVRSERASPPPSVDRPQPSVVSTPSQGSAAATVSADPKVVAEDAKAALERQRAAIVKTCVQPSLAKQKDPPTIKVGLNFTFDSEGKQITRGIAEDRATARADVLSCLSEKLQPISVSPPGANTYVEIPWELP